MLSNTTSYFEQLMLIYRENLLQCFQIVKGSSKICCIEVEISKADYTTFFIDLEVEMILYNPSVRLNRADHIRVRSNVSTLV